MTQQPKALQFDTAPTAPRSVVSAASTTHAPVVRPIRDIDYEKVGGASLELLAKGPSELLSHVTATDVDELGTQLTTLVGLTKKLDPTTITKPGVVKRIASLFGAASTSLMAEFTSIESQMDSVVKAMHATIEHARKRRLQLTGMYENTQEAHRQLGEVLLDLEHHLVEMQQMMSTMDTTDAITYGEAERKIERCEMKIDTLVRSRHMAVVFAQQFADTRNNLQMLIDKCIDVEHTTIPVWKSALAEYVIQLEAGKQADLVDAVHTATEDAFKAQATARKITTEKLSVATRRPVVTLATMQEVQKSFIESLDIAAKAADAARQDRAAARTAISQMEQELINHVVPLTRS